MNPKFFSSLLSAQKTRLIERIPELKFHFVDVDVDGCPLPFLPIRVFRQFHVFQKQHAHLTFFSSGSTNSTRARHSFTAEGIDVYQRETSNNFAAFLDRHHIHARTPIISLIPSAKQWPTSSLAAMIEMYGQCGFDIRYVDVEQPFSLVDIDSDQIIIFGTSFHHILAAKHQHLHAELGDKHVVVIDTGGTKGRTQSFSVTDIVDITKKTYEHASRFSFVSEYGMCELASQAWSRNAMHDGYFITNTTLTPLIIDIDQRKVADDKTVGFLAFIDEANIDSYAAIITEDLAYMDERNNCFKLVSRAPDASLKGCSLQVKENFFSSTSIVKTTLLSPKAEFDNVWDDDAKRDLELTLRTIDDAKHLSIAKTRLGQKVLFVLPSNIPIAWLYPAMIFFLRGAREIHLQLPSLRAGDPLSDRIRAQTFALAQRMRNVLPLVIHEQRDITFLDMHDFDAVVVFGTDDTIKTFEGRLGDRVIGLGHVTNALTIEQNSDPQKIADICARWFGRGCLTPVALVSDQFTKNFVENFIHYFDEKMSSRFHNARLENKFSHRHTLLGIEAFIKSHSIDPQSIMFYGSHTFVICLYQHDFRVDDIFDVVSLGGAGLIFLLNQHQAQSLNFFPADPGLLEKHAGKTWLQWIE